MNLPAAARLIGQDHRGFYIPRDYTMELAHRRRTGLGRRGESAVEIVASLIQSGFTHVMLCPPVSDTTVEFDPTLGQLLAPWTSRPNAALPRPAVRRRRSRPTLFDLRALGSRSARRRSGPAANHDAFGRRHRAMTAVRPTIAELRARVQKDRHREIGNWLARRVARPTAVYGCWLAIRLGLSAHQVTLLALASWLLASVAIGTGDRTLFVVGVVLAQLGFWLDHVDGQVARWRGTVSLDGVYLDYLMHHAANLSLGLRARIRAGRSNPATSDGRSPGSRSRSGWAGLEPAQRLPLQGVLPATEEHDRELPGRRRARRSPAAACSMAAPRPGRLDLAGVQGVRNSRRHDGARRTGRARPGEPECLDLRLASHGPFAGGDRAAARNRPHRTLGDAVRSRIRLLALVHADGRFQRPASASPPERRPLDTHAAGE